MKNFILVILTVAFSAFCSQSYSQVICTFDLDSVFVLPEFSGYFVDVYGTTEIIADQAHENYIPIAGMVTASVYDQEDILSWIFDEEVQNGNLLSFLSSFAGSVWYPGENQIVVGVEVGWFDVSGGGNPILVDITYSEMDTVDLPLVITGTSNLSDGEFESLTVYPNPTSTDVVVTGFRDVDDEIFVYDLLGNVVLRKRTNKLDRVSISLIKLPAGMYILRTNTGVVKITKTG